MANLKDWDVLWLSCSSQETLSKDDNSVQSNVQNRHRRCIVCLRNYHRKILSFRFVYKAFITKIYFELCLPRMRSQKRPLVCRWGRRVEALRITYQRFTNKSPPCPPMLWGSICSGMETTELLCTNKGAEPTWRLLLGAALRYPLSALWEQKCTKVGTETESSCCPDRWKVGCVEG